MEKQADAMLKFIKQNLNPFGKFYVGDINEKYCKENNVEYDKAGACLQYLVEQGYIFTEDEGAGYYLIKHEGYEVDAFKRIRRNEFIFKSMLVPILVALLASAFVNYALPSLLEWLSSLLTAK